MCFKQLLFLCVFGFSFSFLQAQDPGIFIMEGNARDEVGDYKGALEAYTEAIELQPDFAMAYFNRALVKRKLEDYQGAIDDYSKAIELIDYYTIAYHNRGIAYILIGELEKACIDWNKAYTLGHEDALKLLDDYCRNDFE